MTEAPDPQRGGATLSPSSAETINDGQFHTVELVTFDQMVNLSIDGGSPMTMDNFGKHYTLNSEAPLYVGGEAPRREQGLIDRTPPFILSQRKLWSLEAL